MKIRFSRKTLFLLLIPLLFGGVALGRYIAAALKEKEKDEPQVALVKTVFPTQGSITDIMEYTGTLVPDTTVILHPRVAGRILFVSVEEGDQVKKGDLLVSLDKEILQLQADQAKANWQAAKASYEKAKRGARDEEIENAHSLAEQYKDDVDTLERTMERTKRLYESGAVAKTKVEEVENQYKGARTRYENALRSLKVLREGAAEEDLEAAAAKMEGAKKTYELALLQLRESDVRAPISGTVSKIFIEKGNYVGPSVSLLSLVKEDSLLVKLFLPEKRYSLFRENKENMGVTISVPSLANRMEFHGVLSSVSPVIDPGSRTFDVEITILNNNQFLSPGMFVYAAFTPPADEDMLLLPEETVVFRDDHPVVFVYSQNPHGSARMTRVTTGISRDGLVEILSGVTMGQRIIIEGHVFLEDGQRVEPVSYSAIDPQ